MQPHTGGGEDAGEGVVVRAHQTVELIGNAHHGDQQQQLDAHAHPDALPVDIGEHKAGDDDGDDEHHKQEAGAAAGVVAGLDADVFHRQGQSRLVAEDSFMLRAVVAEHAVDVLLLGAEDHIQQEDKNFHHTLDQIVDGGAGGVEQSRQKRGQQHEQHQHQSETEDNGECHQQRLQLFGGDVVGEPLLHLAGLRALVLREVVGGEHQCLDAGDHGADERDCAPQDGDAQNGIVRLDEFALRDLGDQTLRRADDDSVLLGAAHEDALDQRLAADAGAEGGLFLFHRRGRFLSVASIAQLAEKCNTCSSCF